MAQLDNAAMHMSTGETTIRFEDPKVGRKYIQGNKRVEPFVVYLFKNMYDKLEDMLR